MVTTNKLTLVVHMQQVMKKYIDKQGRLVLPKEWRDKYLKSQAVLLKIHDDKITIEEYKPPDLMKLINSVDADIKADLEDWKGVKRDLIALR
jgi:bifunctional DNA-binding transcriptional regulator/antitoxin component of YhaV-PrlF toxin-antitoxin module